MITAEFRKARGSVLQYLPLLALPFVALTTFLALYTNPAAGGMTVLWWQALFITGLFAPLTALFAAVPERREADLWWRARDTRRQHVGRLLTVWFSLAAFHAINFGGAALALLTTGQPQLPRLLWAGVLSLFGTCALAGLFTAVARRINLVVSLLIGAAWQVLAIAGAEKTWLLPPAWPMRLLLPVIGVHPNSVPLEPGDELYDAPLNSPFLLCLALLAVGILAAVCTRPPRATSRVQRVWLPALPARSPLGAMNLACLNPGVTFCVLASVALLGATALIYPASYVHGLYTFALLPMGAMILPALVWPPMRCAWAEMTVAHRGSARLLLQWFAVVIVALSLAAALCGLVSGGMPADEARRLLLSILVGLVLCFIGLLCTLLWGPAVTIAVAVMLTIVSLTVGGDVLADTPLWVLAFPAWPETAATTPRVVLALIVSALLAGVLGHLAHRQLLRGVFQRG